MSRYQVIPPLSAEEYKALKAKRLENLPEILTAQQIADYLTISRRRVYELFRIYPAYGGIPNFSIGASKRVEKNDLVQWITKMKGAVKEDENARNAWAQRLDP